VWEKRAVVELEQVRKYLCKGNGRNIRHKEGPEVKYTTSEKSYCRRQGQQQGRGTSSTNNEDGQEADGVGGKQRRGHQGGCRKGGRAESSG
jgi:hypothetical protein